MKRKVLAGLGLLSLTLTTLGVNSPVSAQTASVVMSGLDNPRGLAFGPGGALYVAEAGRGGNGPSIVLQGQDYSYGPTGALTRLWRGKQMRVVTGLPSMATADGSATGPHDVSFQGQSGAYVTIGFGGDPALRAGFGPAGALFGTLIKVPKSGKWRVVSDIAAYEASVNPAGGPLDSNPYGLLARAGATILTDAGGNTLLEVKPNGNISTLAVFPARPVRSTDSVPTAVAIGPDKAYYVSELTGAPFTEGEANVYRVVPGAAPQIFRSGFKTIVDIAFGPDGSLYVLQYATGPVFFSGPGQVIRVMPDGTREVIVSDLVQPTSLAISRNGTLYVTNNGTSIGSGEVLRIQP
ncbi:MAG TPA: ScyD/ScyE family protein [Abditibacteriaceae bacterium]|jgi:hypothetical protein